MSTAPPEHANVHVLIGDDDALGRDYLLTVVRACQCGEISEAASGANVVQVCARQQANLVFLDIELGGGNGIDLIAPILAERPNTFVVMLSAHSTVDNVKASPAQGARGFIVRSEERRVGKGCVSTCRSRWSPY